MVGEHVPHLVPEDRQQLVVGIRADKARAHKGDGLVRADGEAAADGFLGHIELRAAADVEHVGAALVQGPDAGQLVVAEPQCVPGEELAQASLVAVLGEELHDPVEPRHRADRRRRGPFCRVGEALGADPRIPDRRFDRHRHRLGSCRVLRWSIANSADSRTS